MNINHSSFMLLNLLLKIFYSTYIFLFYIICWY